MHYDESFEKNIFSRHNLFAIKKLNINVDIKDRNTSKVLFYYQKTTEYFYFSPKNDIKEGMYGVHLSCNYRICFKSCILSRCKHVIICQVMLQFILR